VRTSLIEAMAADLALLIGTLVLLVSVSAVSLSLRPGLPSLLLRLGNGVAIGEGGLGIRFNSRCLRWGPALVDTGDGSHKPFPGEVRESCCI
jgi:hypothetical protein